MIEQWRSLNALHTRVEAALERALEDANLSLTEYAVLDAMSRQRDRHLRMHEVATVAALSGSAATRLVNRLETRGLIERVLCDDDRRGIYSALTPAGHALRTKAQPIHDVTLKDTLEEAAKDDNLKPLVAALLVVEAV